MITNDGMCSLSEYNDLKTAIFDAVDEWMTLCDRDPEAGIAIHPETHEVQLLIKEDATEPLEWHPIATLLNANGDPDAVSILDLTDTICFVR